MSNPQSHQAQVILAVLAKWPEATCRPFGNYFAVITEVTFPRDVATYFPGKYLANGEKILGVGDSPEKAWLDAAATVSADGLASGFLRSTACP